MELGKKWRYGAHYPETFDLWEMGHDDLWPVNETRHWSRSLGRRLRGGAGLTLPLGVAVNLDGLIWGGESTARGKVWRWEKSRLALVAVWEPRPLSMPPM